MSSVLIVDDSTLIRNLVRRALQAEGHVFLEASNGYEALEQLDGNDVDLLICDVNMPRMNGIELLQSMKESGGHSDVLIIMLTTESQPELVRQARSLGALGWLVKPLRPELLVGAVRQLLG